MDHSPPPHSTEYEMNEVKETPWNTDNTKFPPCLRAAIDSNNYENSTLP